MTPSEWIAAVKDVLLGGAAVTTAVVAVTGLKKWRQELEGKSQFDAARGLVKSTYKLRDQLQVCRSPFYSAHEFPTDYKGGHGTNSAEEEARAWAHVYKNRWDSVWDAIQEFDSQTLEAEALWGASIRTKTEALRQCVREVNAAIDAVISDKVVGGENFKADKEFAKAMRSIVAASRDDEKNEMNQKMAKAISSIEDEVRPHLRQS
jgi:hypothetical protein